MKHTFFMLLALTAASSLVLTSCSKDIETDYAAADHTHLVDQVKSYYRVVTFDAANQQVAAATTDVDFLNNDVVLVYMEAETGIYVPLPYTDISVAEGALFQYACSNGRIAFMADCGSGYNWTGNFSKEFHILVIPQTIYTDCCARGVDHTDWQSVRQAYALTADNCE